MQALGLAGDKMKILGIRCSTTDFTYAVLDGNKATPSLLGSEVVVFPKGYEQP